MAFVHSQGAFAVAALATTVSLCISSYSIACHLTNYTVPRVQRYIVRILCVSPVYALGSLLSLRYPRASNELDTLRDVMEAFVIYSFLALVLEYAGGDAACLNGIKHEPPLRHPFPLCFLRPIPKDGRFLRLCKQGTLQFVFVKPFMAMVSLIMISKHRFDSAWYQILLLVIYNLSYSIALYALLLFYLGIRSLLVQYHPVFKWAAVKSVVFATYWQSLLIRLWARPEDAAATQNFVICVEMVAFAAFLGVAFSHREYMTGMPGQEVLRNITEVFSVKDTLQDAYHSFMPAYQDYVLQRPSPGRPGSSGSGGAAAPAVGGRKTYRTRTFLVGNVDHWRLRDHDELEGGEMLDVSDEMSVGSTPGGVAEPKGLHGSLDAVPAYEEKREGARGSVLGGGGVRRPTGDALGSRESKEGDLIGAGRASFDLKAPELGLKARGKYEGVGPLSPGDEFTTVSLATPPRT